MSSSPYYNVKEDEKNNKYSHYHDNVFFTNQNNKEKNNGNTCS